MFESVIGRLDPDGVCSDPLAKIRQLGILAATPDKSDLPKGVRTSRLNESEYKRAIESLRSLKYDAFGYGHIRETTRRVVARQKAELPLTYTDVAEIIVQVAEHDQDPGDSL